MTGPIRVQRRRTAGWKLPPNTVCVTRPGKFGNPFNWKDCPKNIASEAWAKATAVAFFREWLNGKREGPNGEDPDGVLNSVHTLRGKNLACWCSENDPCHADILLDLANPHRSLS